MPILKTLERFIEDAKLKHPNKGYDYSKFIYVNSNTEGIIICLEKNEIGNMHGEFIQTPDYHLNSKGGCKKCNGGVVLTKAEFEIKGNHKHNGIYDYSKFQYVNAKTLGTIICPIHGNFEQTPSNHLSGHGCWTCGGSAPLNKVEFEKRSKKIHGDTYDYSKFQYVNARTLGIIICRIHGEFNKTPDDHLRLGGCSLCSPNKRLNEKIVKKFLTDNNISFKKIQIKLSVNEYNGGRYTLPDIYIPFLNLIIEYNGAHHYQPVRYGNMIQEEAQLNFETKQLRDQQLREYCKNNNINLFEIDGRKYQGKKLTKYLYSTFFNIILINNIYS